MVPANTTSIYAHREKITNPKVEIIYKDGADATGHEHMTYEPDMDLFERIEKMFSGAR